MTENLAAPPPPDASASSILAPRRRVRVSPWFLALALALAVGFGGGWATSLATQTSVSAPCACVPPSPTATPTPEVDNEDDSVFVDLATRDIDDFAKDLGDLSTTVDEGGFWRLLTNSVELNFNLTQLEGHEEPASIKADWNDRLDELSKNVDSIEDGISAQSENRIRAGIAAARSTIAELRDIVSRVD